MYNKSANVKNKIRDFASKKLEKEDHYVEQLSLFKELTTEWWSENLFNIQF